MASARAAPIFNKMHVIAVGSVQFMCCVAPSEVCQEVLPQEARCTRDKHTASHHSAPPMPDDHRDGAHDNRGQHELKEPHVRRTHVVRVSDRTGWDRWDPRVASARVTDSYLVRIGASDANTAATATLRRARPSRACGLRTGTRDVLPKLCARQGLLAHASTHSAHPSHPHPSLLHADTYVGPAMLVLPLFMISLVNLFVAGPPLKTIVLDSSGECARRQRALSMSKRLLSLPLSLSPSLPLSLSPSLPLCTLLTAWSLRSRAQNMPCLCKQAPRTARASPL
jgi:hypothetical protein